MEKGYYPEETEEARLEYQNQLEELHKLSAELERKVRHISVERQEKDGNTPSEMKPQLNRELDEVIRRFRAILSNIKN